MDSCWIRTCNVTRGGELTGEIRSCVAGREVCERGDSNPRPRVLEPDSTGFSCCRMVSAACRIEPSTRDFTVSGVTSLSDGVGPLPHSWLQADCTRVRSLLALQGPLVRRRARAWWGAGRYTPRRSTRTMNPKLHLKRRVTARVSRPQGPARMGNKELRHEANTCSVCCGSGSSRGVLVAALTASPDTAAVDESRFAGD